CRRLKIEHGIDLILIDYLQLMSGSGEESRQQEVSEISRNIKAIAKEMQCPVIALSQLSRAPEQRADHRPMLSDLRESGSIEQDADLVMFLYRDEYYNKETEEKNVGECIIAKQRNGPVGTVKLAWLGQYSKFANLDTLHRE
ncbi:MAG: DnaB-like helicase C-terminal domain-containing protein, partial [Sarcina sp.]